MSWLIKGVLEFLYGKLVLLAQWLFEVGYKAYKKLKRHKEIDKEAKDSVEPLKKATTAEAIDEASKSALDGF